MRFYTKVSVDRFTPVISEELACTRSFEEIDHLDITTRNGLVIEHAMTARVRKAGEKTMGDSAGCRKRRKSGGERRTGN